MRLRLMAGLSALFLLLLMVFALHDRLRVELLEQSSGLLEMLAAGIPLLSLVLASLFHRDPRQHGKRRSTRQPRRPVAHRRPKSSAPR